MSCSSTCRLSVLLVLASVAGPLWAADEKTPAAPAVTPAPAPVVKPGEKPGAPVPATAGTAVTPVPPRPAELIMQKTELDRTINGHIMKLQRDKPEVDVMIKDFEERFNQLTQERRRKLEALDPELKGLYVRYDEVMGELRRLLKRPGPMGDKAKPVEKPATAAAPPVPAPAVKTPPTPPTPPAPPAPAAKVVPATPAAP